MGADLAVDVTVDFAARRLRLALASDAEVVGLVGPSGAGKSTFLRVVAGVERRARGRVQAFGERWADGVSVVPPWRRGVGWVPQDAALFPHLDVGANLAYAARGDVAEIAAWLGLGPLLDRAPRNLSGGERQRVALGRALASRPRLLLLDEPFAALDRALRDRLAAELAARCRDARLPVVLVTHDERDLAAFAADRWVCADTGLTRA